MTAVITTVNPITHSYTIVSVWSDPDGYHIVDIDGTWLVTISIGDDAFKRVVEYIKENDLKVDEVSICQFEELRIFGE